MSATLTQVQHLAGRSVMRVVRQPALIVPSLLFPLILLAVNASGLETATEGKVVLDNQESAPHNIAISDSTGASVFKGEIVTNQKVTYQVPALAAGAYPFICEVHPDMKGTITAE